ncbi:MAG: hypothetical protein IKY26_04525 [Erysipelotrichaceae bacterium]|nr:hypothetical protein [Erysipelotrichaceae bacterium]
MKGNDMAKKSIATPLAKVEIKDGVKWGKTSIIIDGQEVAGKIRRYTLTHVANQVPSLYIEFIPEEIDVSALVDVMEIKNDLPEDKSNLQMIEESIEHGIRQAIKKHNEIMDKNPPKVI